MNQPLLVMVGATAVGKTRLSLRVALSMSGEIVSADSRQIYRGMDVGTDKVSAETLAQVPHHLIDVVEPNETLTLAQYQHLASAAIDNIVARGKLPILVGGSGQYVRAVVEGWRVPQVAPRKPLRAFLDDLGTEELSRWLAELDAAAANRIDPRNRRRVIRALEVTLVTGRPISVLQRKTPPAYHVLQIGLTVPRAELYSRIDARVARMMANGLLDETRRLGERYGWAVPAMSALGYAQLAAYVQGKTTLDVAVADIKRETRRFVRQQANWFKPTDPAIHWFDGTDPDQAASQVEARVRGWLRASR